MSLTAAEKKVRKLARVPGNCQCANCGTVKKLGYSTVCIKFHTFVCNSCKSSHQAISHRCKSLTMSSWTDAEVDELQRKGNDHARRTWLKTAPPPGAAGRPKEGDHVDVFKRFVVDVYERKKFYGPDDGPGQQYQQHPAPGVSTAIPISQPPAQVRQRQFVRAPVTAAVPLAPSPAPAPVVDLLDFAAAPQAAKPSPATFEANFDAFQTTQAAPVAAASQSAFGFISPAPVAAPVADPAAASISQSGFGFIAPPPAAPPASASSGFGFIPSAPAAATPPSANDNNFADFSGMSSTSAGPAPAVKKPVMSNSGNQQALLISSMNMAPSGGQQQFGNNMMGNFGMQQGFDAGAAQPNMMMQQNMMGMPHQQQMMMQQNIMAQQRIMQQNMMGSNNNNNIMMGGMNSNNGMGMMMMNQQQPGMGMGFGGQGQQINNNMKQSMNSLDMNMSSMSAWSSGGANGQKK